jgi:hypothetical protein
MDKKQLMTDEPLVDTRREERYHALLSPFEEYLPGLRPSNSGNYLLRLAIAMKEKKVEEAVCVRMIVERSPFTLEAADVQPLVHFAYTTDVPALPMTDKQMQTMRQLEFMNRRYVFRYNEVLGVTEYLERKPLHTAFHPVDERALNSIAINALEEGINMWDRDVKRYLKSDRVCPYNPFDTFLSGLPVWDKRPRIDKFFRRVPVDDEAWYGLAHTWFLGMVALWMQKNRRKGNESMLVLVGEQGTGKSTFCRSLMPKELMPYYTENFALTDRRKALLMLSRYGLINFDEMNRITERQQPTLKNMLQLPVVDEFKPYASTSAQERRYASLAGTSNNRDVITDLTGSRRYICALVTGPIKALPKHYNHAQLYAEAVAEIHAGTRYWLDEKEETALTERNLRFVRLPVEAEEFDTLFTPARPGEEGAVWLYASEIYKALHPTINKPMTRQQLRDFSALMTSRKVQSKRGNGGLKYLVKKKC